MPTPRRIPRRARVLAELLAKSSIRAGLVLEAAELACTVILEGAGAHELPPVTGSSPSSSDPRGGQAHELPPIPCSWLLLFCPLRSARFVQSLRVVSLNAEVETRDEVH
jgi:hypothetical protein